MKKRLLYISSIPLNNSSGGATLMYNHLKKGEDFEVLEIDNKTILEYQTISSFGKVQNAFWERANRTRFCRWLQGLNQLNPCWQLPAQLQTKIKEFDPDVVMTVAHGNLFWLANKVAKQIKKPLVSIYHDWWPTLVQEAFNLNHRFLKEIERRFRQLYAESDCVLCISEGMHQELGEHHRNNVHILYPLANYSSTSIDFSTKTENDNFHVVYTGKLNHSYGELLQQLAKISDKAQNFKLSIHGNNSDDWSQEIREQAIQRNILKPFVSGTEFISTLAEASALLTVVSFDNRVASLMRTNFPSKLATYAAFSKPLIVWAPPYSTAARFMKKNDVGLLVEDPNPQVLIRAINRLANSPQQQQELAEKARKLHSTLLNPDIIQDQFVRYVNNLCGA